MHEGDFFVIRTEQPIDSMTVSVALAGVYELYLDGPAVIPHIVSRLAAIGIQATVECAELVWMCKD
jgi:hypothetical protein